MIPKFSTFMEAKGQTDAAEANRLLARAKEMMRKYRDDPALGVHTRAWRIKELITSWKGSSDPAKKKVYLNGALKFEKEMDRAIRGADKEKEFEKAAKAIPPITVCDIFSDPTPKRLYELMDENLWHHTLVSNGIISSSGYSYDYDAPAWMERLKRDVWSPFAEWFEAEGGSKQGIIPKILAMASCKKRAAWANWSGTAYRGLKRSLARVAKYEYTDKTVVIGGRTWLVASVSYRSKYAVQSWTSETKIAKNFANGGMNDVAVILEMKIEKGDGFLSPEVSNRLARNYKESEVLRIGNEPTKVKAYIEVRGLVNLMLDIVANTRVPSWWDNLPSEQKKKEWIRITSEKLNRLGFSKKSIENMTKPNHPFFKEMLKGKWG
jgi:hypothetical protein